MQDRQTLLESIIQLAPKNEIWHTPIKGLTIHAADQSITFNGYVQEPSLCVVMLGKRQICTNGNCQIFDENEMMFCPVNLPITVQKIDVPEKTQYLALSLQIDFELLARIMAQLPAEKSHHPPSTQTKWQRQESIDDCLLRLIKTCFIFQTK